MDEELFEIMPDGFSPSQVRGITELTARVSAVVSGVEVARTVTVRRQYKLSLPFQGCPEPEEKTPASGMGFGLGMVFTSMFHVNPVELGRIIRRERRAAGWSS